MQRCGRRVRVRLAASTVYTPSATVGAWRSLIGHSEPITCGNSASWTDAARLTASRRHPGANHFIPARVQPFMIHVALSLALTLSPATVTEIPKNFLLMERAARTPLSSTDAAEKSYEISDKLSTPLELNPCGHRRAVDGGRLAARTITLGTSAPSYSSEQLIVYKSPRAAHAVLTRLRAEVKRCARKGDPSSRELSIRWRTSKAKVGDEALGMGYQTRQDGYEDPRGTGLVARKGSALMIYTTDEGDYFPGGLTKQARRMAAKVCKLPGVC